MNFYEDYSSNEEDGSNISNDTNHHDEFSNEEIAKRQQEIEDIKNQEEELSHKKYLKELNEYFLSFEQEKYPNSPRFEDYYKFESILGKGAFGQVISAIQKSDNKRVAIKIIEKKQFKKFDGLDKEAKILQHLDHPNIIKFLAAHESSKVLIIVMEYFDGVSLDQFLKSRVKPFNNDDVREIVQKILQAIHHMHSSEVLHRDLKPENILIREQNGKFDVRIIDFGLSFKNEQIGAVSDNCGTLIYMAPEVAFNRQYQRSVDLWSCGIIQYMLFTMGKHPLWVKSDDKKSFLKKLKNPQWIFPPNMNQEAKQFFLKTAAPIAEDRMSAYQCLKHVWISGEGHISDPLTMSDKIQCFQNSQSLCRVIKLLMVSEYLKKTCKDKGFSISNFQQIKSEKNEINDEISKIFGFREKSESINNEEINKQYKSTHVLKSQNSFRLMSNGPASPQKILAKINRKCTFDDDSYQIAGKVSTSKSQFNYESLTLKDQISENKSKKDREYICEEASNLKESLDESDFNLKSESSNYENISLQKFMSTKRVTDYGGDEEIVSPFGTNKGLLSHQIISKTNQVDIKGEQSSPLLQVSRNSDGLISSQQAHTIKKQSMYHIRKYTQKKNNNVDVQSSIQAVCNSQQPLQSDNLLNSGECIDSPLGINNSGICSIKNIFGKQQNNIRTAQIIKEEDQIFKRSSSTKINYQIRRNSKSSVNLQQIKSNGNSPSNLTSQTKDTFGSLSFTQQIQQHGQQQQSNEFQPNSHYISPQFFKMNTLKEQQEENLTTERSTSEFQVQHQKQQREPIQSQHLKTQGGGEQIKPQFIGRNTNRNISRKSCDTFNTNNQFFVSNITNQLIAQQNNNVVQSNGNGNINLKNNNPLPQNGTPYKTQKGLQTFLSPRVSCPVNKISIAQISQSINTIPQQIFQQNTPNNLQKNIINGGGGGAYMNAKNKDLLLDLNRKQRTNMKSISKMKEVKAYSLQNSPQILSKQQVSKEYLNIDDNQVNSSDNQFKKRRSEQSQQGGEYFKFNFDIQDQILLQQPNSHQTPQFKQKKASLMNPNSSSPQENTLKLPPISQTHLVPQQGNGGGQNDFSLEQSPLTISNLSINSFNSDQTPSQTKGLTSSTQSLKLYDKITQHNNHQHLKSHFYNPSQILNNPHSSNQINSIQINNNNIMNHNNQNTQMINSSGNINNNNNNNNQATKKVINKQLFMQIK